MLAAIKLAWVLGFRRIFLLGADFRMEGDSEKGHYFFPENRSEQARKNNTKIYRCLNRYFDALSPFFDSTGLSVFNCTPHSGLGSFPYLPLVDALSLAKVSITESTLGRYTDKS